MAHEGVAKNKGGQWQFCKTYIGKRTTTLQTRNPVVNTNCETHDYIHKVQMDRQCLQATLLKKTTTNAAVERMLDVENSETSVRIMTNG